MADSSSRPRPPVARPGAPLARSGAPLARSRLVSGPSRGPLAGPSPAFGDLAEVVARFGAELRRAGLPVGPGRCERFASAVTLARPRTPDDLYLCALATLVSGRDEIEILRAVFNQLFAGLAGAAVQRDDQHPPAPGLPASPEDLLAQAAQAAKAHLVESRPAGTPDAGDSSQQEPEREFEDR
jgi:uncharacterized protein